MKIAVRLGEQAFHLMLFNLCSQNGYGDYEGFADCEWGINLPVVASRLNYLGFKVDGCNDRICRAQKSSLRVTIFPAGRLIIEGVHPDSPSEALKTLLDILELRAVPSQVEEFVT
jgi:hypothetical protein